MILHTPTQEFHFSEMEINQDFMSGYLSPNIDRPIYYSKERPKRRVKDEEKPIFQEIHLYTQQEFTSGKTIISFEDLTEIAIINPDTGTTVMAIVGSALVLSIAAMLIALALKSSCPFVYVNDGEAFVFQGEIFGGAIFPSLERHDYLPLPALQAEDGSFKIRISNELKERQFTNLAKLISVSHPAHTKVLLDQQGQAQLIGQLIPPIKALSMEGADLLSLLSQKDKQIYAFNEPEAEKNAVELSFPMPDQKQDAKLIIKARNSFWFDWLYGEFNEKLGTQYKSFVAKQSQRSKAELEQKGIARQFPLSISAKAPTGWQVLEYLPTVGPMATRDFVIPIPAEYLMGNTVEIRISTGFYFWELDYAAMSFTENKGMEITETLPNDLLWGGEDNRLVDLLADDDQYLAQLTQGEIVEIHYPAAPTRDQQQQTHFLHIKGYYEHVRAYNHPPDIFELLKFKRADYFNTFSKTEYLKYIQSREMPEEELVAD